MLITVINPINNTEVEVELNVQVSATVTEETRTLYVIANGTKEL